MGAGLILVETGMLSCLTALVAAWLPSLRMGLYDGDLDISRTTTILNITPANFSGYSGLHALPGWSVPALDGDLAVSYATPRLWTCAGGGQSNWVGGYYVVDPAGALVWAEQFADGPVLMATSLDVVQITPAYAVGSRYPR